MNKVIYSDIDFWEHFEASQRRRPESIVDPITRLDLCPLLKKSYINFCCSFEVFKERVNASECEYLRKVIVKGYSDSSIEDLKFNNPVDFNIPLNIDSIRNNVDKTVVCLTEKDYSRETEELGVIDITPYNYDRLKLTGSNYIKKGDQGNWVKITDKIERMCNAVVIMDKYLFSNGLDKIKELLDCFVSQNIKIDFHLTILTDKIVKKQDYPTDEDIERKLKEKETKIRKHLSSTHPGINFVVEIFRIKGKVFHDRVLLTNYCYLTIGAGFDLFNDSGTAQHEGDITMDCPCFTGNELKYNDRIDTARHAIKAQGKESKNRLLL